MSPAKGSGCTTSKRTDPDDDIGDAHHIVVICFLLLLHNDDLNKQVCIICLEVRQYGEVVRT
jgi:hypothetical protein